MRNKIIAAFLLLLLFYVAGMFMSAKLFIADWTYELRLGLGSSWICCVIMALIKISIEEEIKSKK